MKYVQQEVIVNAFYIAAFLTCQIFDQMEYDAYIDYFVHIIGLDKGKLLLQIFSCRSIT